MSTAYEVVWPLNRWDYLTLQDPVTMSTPGDESTPPPMPPSPGRYLATPLLATACTQERVGALLGISRRSVGRTLALDVGAMLRDEEAVTVARTCLEDTESRGGTMGERDAAMAWLDRALREESPVERVEPPSIVAPAVETPRPRRVSVRARHVARKTNSRVSGRLMAAVRRVSPAPCVGLAPEQLHVLVQQQQRILRRSMVIAGAAKADALDPPMLREVIAEFLGDITEAARTIGTILQQAPR